ANGWKQWWKRMTKGKGGCGGENERSARVACGRLGRGDREMERGRSTRKLWRIGQEVVACCGGVVHRRRRRCGFAVQVFDGGVDGVVWREDAVVMAWWFW
ncbi:hypothetical protein HAX54_033583, partial [Datura stramonium]|nr:hypothetical protein [Datura stramonium]